MTQSGARTPAARITLDIGVDTCRPAGYTEVVSFQRIRMFATGLTPAPFCLSYAYYAAESEVAGAAADGLPLPGGWSVTHAIGGGAEVGAALHHAPVLFLKWVLLAVRRAAGVLNIARDAARVIVGPR